MVNRAQAADVTITNREQFYAACENPELNQRGKLWDVQYTNDDTGFYFHQGSYTYNANFHFTGHLIVKNGYSNNANYTFVGAMTSSEDVEWTFAGAPVGQNWILQGDMSRFFGSINFTGGSNQHLRFQDNISNTGNITMLTGTLHVQGARMLNRDIVTKNLEITSTGNTFQINSLSVTDSVTIGAGAVASFDGAYNYSDEPSRVTIDPEMTMSTGSLLRVESTFNGEFWLKNGLVMGDGSSFVVAGGSVTVDDGIDGSNAEFAVSGNGNRGAAYLNGPVTLGSLSVSEGDLSLSDGEVVLGSALTVNEKGALFVRGRVSLTGGLDLTHGSTTVSITRGSSLELKVSAGTSECDWLGSVDVQSSSSLTVAQGIFIGGHSNLTVAGKGTVNVLGTYHLDKAEVARAGSIIVGDGGVLELVTPLTGTGSLEVLGSVEVKAGGQFNVSSNSSIGVRSGATVQVGGAMAVSGSAINVDSNGSFVISSNGTLTLTDGSRMSIAAGGILRVQGGTLDAVNGQLELAQGSKIQMVVKNGTSMLRLNENFDDTNLYIELADNDLSEGGTFDILDEETAKRIDLEGKVHIARGAGRDQTITVNEDGTITIGAVQSKTLTWTEETSVWQNRSGDWKDGEGTDFFVNHDSVVFDVKGEHSVVMKGDVTAKNMTVNAGDFAYSGEGSFLLTGKLSINEGASVHFIGNVADLIESEVKDGGTLSLGASVTQFRYIAVDSGAKLVIERGEVQSHAVEAGEETLPRGISVSGGGYAVVATSGVKNFAPEKGMRGVLVEKDGEGHAGVLRVENVTDWQGYVAGEGTMELSLEMVTEMPGDTEDAEPVLVPNSYDLSNESVGALLDPQEQIATVKLVDGSILQFTAADQAEKVAAIGDLQVTSGSAFIHRVGGVSIGNADHTLTLEGETVIQDVIEIEDAETGEITRKDVTYAGALMLGLYDKDGAGEYGVDFNIVLAGDASVYVAEGTEGVFGATDESGALNANAHTLSVKGEGTLTLGSYFTTADNSSGRISVQSGTLVYNSLQADALHHYSVHLADGAQLRVGNQADAYVLGSLSGEGKVCALGASAVLAISNEESSKTDRNSFSGTLLPDTTLEMLSGYQALSLVFKEQTKIIVSGGTLDLGGSTHEAETGSMILTAKGTEGMVTNMTLRGGDTLLLEDGALLTLCGENTLKLTPSMGDPDAAPLFVMNGGEFALADGAVLRVDMSSVLSELKANPGDIYSYLIANTGIKDWGDVLTFGAELALQNLTVSLGEDGRISLSAIPVSKDSVYVSSEDNVGSSKTAWDAAGDVYASADAYTGVYIDKETHIDLKGAERGKHEDGLILKNLMSSAEGDLYVTGDGSGESMVTINNNLSRKELDKIAAIIGVKIEERLTLAGNVTVSGADLQIKHKDGENGAPSADSTTLMTGTLKLSDSRLTMTSGVLILSGEDNDLGDTGISFAGNDAQLVIDGTAAQLGGRIELAGDGVTDTTRTEHIKLEHLAEVQLKAGSHLGAGITLGSQEGDAPSLSGVVTVASISSASDASHLRNVLLHLEKDSILVISGDGVAAEPAALAEMPAVSDWSIAGLTGTGSMVTESEKSGTVDINVVAADRSFSGDLSRYKGTMIVRASDFVQRFDGVRGGRDWNITNTAGGRVELNLMGGSAPNSLTMGTLTLQKDSFTSLLMNMENMVGKVYLNLQGLVIEDGADVTIGQAVGTISLQGKDGEVFARTIGSINVAEGGVFSIGEDVKWHLKGIRNASDVFIHVNDDGTIFMDAVVSNSNGFAEHVTNENALAGANLLWAIQNSYTLGGDLAAVDSVVSELLLNGAWKTPGNVEKASRVMAAVAGASVAVMSDAVSADVERQLRAIRNRTTTLSYGEEPDHATSAAWVNAESNYRKQRADGLMPGYKVSGWGGTVGVYTELGEGDTAGLALTAMYNDLQSEGPDSLKGNMDTLYLSAFAQVVHGAWRHVFVGTIGSAKLDVNRTVNYGAGSYTTHGSTDGMAFGLMYELGYTMPLDTDYSMCLQPILNIAWRMNQIKGYTESGTGNANLRVEEQTYNVVTLGMGARFQSVVGGSAWNRTSIFESRALLKFDAGDRGGSAEVSFLSTGAPHAHVKSAERGAVGVELGAGITVPSAHFGELFLDFSAELRADYTDLNATLGYKVSF